MCLNQEDGLVDSVHLLPNTQRRNAVLKKMKEDALLANSENVAKKQKLGSSPATAPHFSGQRH